MSKINNITAYEPTTPTPTTILIGSMDSAGATRNYLVSALATYMSFNLTNLTLTGYLTVGGATTLNGNLIANGATTLADTTVDGTLGVTGATTLSSTLGVTGATTLSSTLEVTGATTLSSTLGVTGVTTMGSDLTVNGLLAPLNLTMTSNPPLFGAGLNVLGTASLANTTVSSTLGVTGATTLSSTLDVTSATQLNSSLTVEGITTFNDGVTATSSFGVLGTASLANTTVSTTLGVTGATTLSTLTTTGLAEVGGNLLVTGSLTVGSVSTLPFADNAAAVAGGVAVGAIYRTDGTGAAPLNAAGILMVRL